MNTNSASPSHRPLNQKQRHFLDRYHITGNLGQSWLDAGYNCSIESASSNAGRVLQREDAQAYLRELQQHDRDKSGCTREMIIDRFKQILFSENARDRDVILAGREIARMIGAYQPPGKETEPKEDSLQQYIRKVRSGEIPQETGEPEPRKPELTERQKAFAEHQASAAAMWLPTPSDVERAARAEETGEPLPYETPLEKLARYKEEKAARKITAERDPDWHPLYNPYYDPTIQKPKGITVITPRTR